VGGSSPEIEHELIQTQMAQKPVLRVEVYARVLRASQNVKRAEVWWARNAPYGWAGGGNSPWLRCCCGAGLRASVVSFKWVGL
jgi:hypothetical protein